jgi:putative membrane protein
VTCCLLFTLFVGGVTDRSGRLLGRPARPTASRGRLRVSALLAARLGPRWRVWLVGLATAEIAAAWLLVAALVGLDRSTGTDVMRMGSASTSTAATISLLLVGWLGGGVALLSARISPPLVATTREPWWTSSRACAYWSFAGYALAIWPSVRSAATESHLVLMAQTMVLLVVAPALLAMALSATPGPSETRRVGPLPALAAGAYLLILFGWHVPRLHAAAMTDAGVDWVRIASTIAAGLLLWRFAFSPRVRPSVRLGALLAAGAGSGLLGIAFLVSPRPLLALMTSGPLGVSSLTDQRLAGLVMMAVDLGVFLPVATALANQAGERTPVLAAVPVADRAAVAAGSAARRPSRG